MNNKNIRANTFIGMGSLLLSIVLLLALVGTANAAGDVNSGKIKAISCQVCHGKDGISTNPIYPNLAGQHAEYIEKQMHDFKTKKRIDPVMNEMAQSLSDQDIADISAFFESIQ